MDEFEHDEDPTPKTHRKSKWQEMAKERELWDQEPVVRYTTDPPPKAGDPISATGLVRPKFEVLTAKQQVERALLRSGKPDAKETPFVKKTEKKTDFLKDLASRGHVSKLPEDAGTLSDITNFDTETDKGMGETGNGIGSAKSPRSGAHSAASDSKSVESYSYSSYDVISTNDSELQSRNVSRDAMDALSYLNNTINDFDEPTGSDIVTGSIDELPKVNLITKLSELSVSDENRPLAPSTSMDTNNNGDEKRKSLGSKKRSCEAEDCAGNREQEVKRRSTHMRSLGSIDDLSYGLKSPEGKKVTIDDYRATQRLREKPARPELPHHSTWTNAETLRNTSRDTTLKRNTRRRGIEVEVEQLKNQSRQASNAINLLLTKKQANPDVQAEAEKCLLISTEKVAILERVNEQYPVKSASKGQVVLSDISIKGTKTTFGNLSTFDPSFEVNWAIALITIGDEFFASSLAKVDEYGDVKLKMEEEKGKRKVFRNVPPSFELTVSIYTLKTMTGEPKQRSSSMNKIVGSLFNRKNSRKSMNPAAASTSQLSALSSIRKPGFTLIATKKLRMGDVQNVTNFRLKLAASSSFGNTMECRIVPKYTHSLEYSSFLTVKTKGTGGRSAYGNWIRYWARVKGDKIKFWKYPEDVDDKQCEGFISLYQILNKEVKAVNRNLSRRPNTFELYGKSPKNDPRANVGDHVEGITLDYDPNNFLRYQLSADTIDEKRKWCEALITVLGELRLWDYGMLPPVEDVLH